MKRILLLLGLIFTFSACGENQKSEEKAEVEEQTETSDQDSNPVPEKQPEAVSPDREYKHEVVIGDMSIPWGFDFLPDGSILVTEKGGDIYHFKDGEKVAISGAPEIYNQGQGGLLDIALHPDFETNNFIYWVVSGSEHQDMRRLFRKSVDNFAS